MANRNRPETERLIGYFVNMLALRADLSGESDRARIPGPRASGGPGGIREPGDPARGPHPRARPRRDPSRSPLFQVMFVLQNNRLPTVGPLDLTFSPLNLRPGDRYVEVRSLAGFEDTPEGFTGSVEFNTDLFGAATIDRFSQPVRRKRSSTSIRSPRTAAVRTVAAHRRGSRESRGVEPGTTGWLGTC